MSLVAQDLQNLLMKVEDGLTSSSATSAPWSTNWLLLSLFWKEIQQWERHIFITSCKKKQTCESLCSYLCDSLQAHIVTFTLALLQLFQSHSHLPDEFIPSKSVHVTHTQPSFTNTHTQRRKTSRWIGNEWMNSLNLPVFWRRAWTAENPFKGACEQVSPHCLLSSLINDLKQWLLKNKRAFYHLPVGFYSTWF